MMYCNPIDHDLQKTREKRTVTFVTTLLPLDRKLDRPQTNSWDCSLMKILIAIDESESAREALQQALRLITHQDTSFILLGIEEPMSLPSVSPVPGVFGEDPMLSLPQEVELVEVEKERTLSALQWAEQLCQQAGVEVLSRSELGDPKHLICEVAKQENCDLIVVGSHGYGLFDRVLMGSVSDHVVHHAPCAVLVVRQNNSSSASAS